MLFGVSQGSIVGLRVFNIFLADLFFVVKDIDIGSHLDNSRLLIVENNIHSVIASLEKAPDAKFN